MELLFGSLRPLFTGEIFDTQSLNLGPYLRYTPETDHYLNAKKITIYQVLIIGASFNKEPNIFYWLNQTLFTSISDIFRCHNLINLIAVSLQQEITISSFRVCVKDLAGMESQHDPATVDYAVIGGKDKSFRQY